MVKRIAPLDALSKPSFDHAGMCTEFAGEDPRMDVRPVLAQTAEERGA